MKSNFFRLEWKPHFSYAEAAGQTEVVDFLHDFIDSQAALAGSGGGMGDGGGDDDSFDEDGAGEGGPEFQHLGVPLGAGGADAISNVSKVI